MINKEQQAGFILLIASIAIGTISMMSFLGLSFLNVFIVINEEQIGLVEKAVVLNMVLSFIGIIAGGITIEAVEEKDKKKND